MLFKNIKMEPNIFSAQGRMKMYWLPLSLGSYLTGESHLCWSLLTMLRRPLKKLPLKNERFILAPGSEFLVQHQLVPLHGLVVRQIPVSGSIVVEEAAHLKEISKQRENSPGISQGYSTPKIYHQ